jgi:uncharacterized protein YutE (UPF0331/DUF86 family)
MNKQSLLPDQLYGDKGITNEMISKINPIGIVEPYDNVKDTLHKKAVLKDDRTMKMIKKLEDILTVSEFKELDIDKIVGYTKEDLERYINILLKIKESGIYEDK